MNDRLIDLAARLRAATDFETNLVVTAGAGTGKTSLLIERILNACIGEAIDLPSLAAITFTEKAGAQMRDRLFDALERLRSFGLASRRPDHPGSDEADRAWRYLRSEKGLPAGAIAARTLACLETLDLAVIGTIHSLCADLLRRYPREAGIDPSFQVDDGTAARRLADQTWEEWFAAEMDTTGSRARLWEEILGEVRVVAVRSLGRSLALCSPPWEAAAYAAQQESAAAILKERAAGLRDRIDAILERANGMNPNCDRKLRARLAWLRALAAQGPAGLPGGLGGHEALRHSTPGKKLGGIAPEEVEGAEEASRRLLLSCVEIDPFTDSCMELLGPYANAFRDRFAAAGYLSFGDLLVRSRDLLRDHPEIRKREKSRFRSILVDEFQDTDPLQYEIVFFLSEEIGSTASSAAGTRLERGKLFIVGDPKQSIYRFRGADIEAYHRAVDKILSGDGHVLLLETNFRSPTQILDPLNDLFEAAFDPAAPAQAEYRRIVAADDGGDDGPRIRIWSVPLLPDQGRAEQRRRREGQAIAEWIRTQVCGGERNYKDIAVLFRAMTPIDLYLRPLRESGIPFVVEGGGSFGERTEVRSFLSLLRLMANPNDGIALLSVLRSPIGGVADDELARHAGLRGRWRLDADVAPEGCPAIADSLSVLRRLREAIRHLPPDAAVHRVMDELNLVELNAAAFEGGQRIANLYKLADGVSIRARDERLSLYETVRSLEEEFEAGGYREPESPLADEALDAVRILTVHKAKGLEFPVVIVPDLSRGRGGARIQEDAVRWEQLGQGGGGIAIRIGRRSGRVVNPAEAVCRDIAPQHENAERIRTFYVAATRAREHLILVATPAKSGSWLDPLGAWGYSWPGGDPPAGEAFHRRAVGHEVLSPAAGSARVQSGSPEAEKIAAAVDRFRKAREGAERFRNRPWIVTPSRLPEAAAAAVESVPAVSTHFPVTAASGARRPARTAAAAGIAVHRLLQLWDREDPEWFRVRQAAAARYGAGEAGADPGKVEALVAEILDPFLASSMPRRLQEIDVIGREVPIEAADGDQMLHGLIDLLYRRDGRYVVADFKTDEIAPGREQELLGRYAAQLGAYARAVGKALSQPVPVVGEIWSIRTGSIVKYPDPAAKG